MTVTSDTVAGHQCDFAIEESDKAAVIAVTGELTWHTVNGLHDRIAAVDGRPTLLLDLTNVIAMDSAGTNTLIATYLREARRNVQIVIVARGFIASILKEVGVSQVVPVFGSRISAEEWLDVA